MNDPFPRPELSAFVHRLPAYARLAWNLGRDPQLTAARRAAVLGAAGYLISPVDLIPGIIPVLGQLDDLVLLLAALRFALAGLDPEQRAARLAAVGLQDAHLAEDAHALALSAAWLARTGTRVAVRVGIAGAEVGIAVARRLAPATLHGAQRAGGAAGHELGRVGNAAGRRIGARLRPIAPRAEGSTG